MDTQAYNENLFKFITESPTPFHAASWMESDLTKNGFIPVKETLDWNFEPGKRYVVTRNGSSLIAVVVGQGSIRETGIRMAGAHTDSPCLRVKPNPELTFEGMVRLGVEVYGGALLSTWFDRGLNLAGRVTFRTESPGNGPVLDTRLINFNRPVALVPSLAIHFDREAGTRKTVNPQIHMPPLFRTSGQGHLEPFQNTLMEQLALEYPGIQAQEILGFDLCVIDAQPPDFTGLNREFILAPRLDNLLSCHAAINAIRHTHDRCTSILILADHEEVGSETSSGARGSFLDHVLERLVPLAPDRFQTLARSFMISCDNAHAAHPGHPEAMDGNHLPRLNQGPVLKINASQRYASDSESAALFRHLCQRAGVPAQTFVVRSNMPCGSSIGPAIAARTGVRTVDCGCPTLGMHAIRETTGSHDPFMLYQALRLFFAMPHQPLLSLT
ncbi:MAG: M18 family aminopeptidase [Pseudomonadota bacterium]